MPETIVRCFDAPGAMHRWSTPLREAEPPLRCEMKNGLVIIQDAFDRTYMIPWKGKIEITTATPGHLPDNMIIGVALTQCASDSLLPFDPGDVLAKYPIRSSDPEIAGIEDGALVPTGKKHGIVQVIVDTPELGPLFMEPLFEVIESNSGLEAPDV